MRLFSGAFLLLFALFLLSGCNKQDEFELKNRYEFFPVDSGFWAVYQVDSIIWDDFFVPPKVDTIRFQMMERVESIFEDNTGRPTARIERFRKDSDSTDWTIMNVWSANLTKNTAERKEDNLRFVKLVFPIKENLSWKGNQYIQIDQSLEAFADWTYTITDLDVSRTYNGKNFPQTLRVLHRDEENLIEKIFSEEVYAENAGLVYKRFLHLKKQNVVAPWSQPESGFIVTLTLLDYKK